MRAATSTISPASRSTFFTTLLSAGTSTLAAGALKDIDVIAAGLEDIAERAPVAALVVHAVQADEVAEEVRVLIQLYGVGAVDVEQFPTQFLGGVAVANAFEREEHGVLCAAAGSDVHGHKALPALEICLSKAVKTPHIAGDGAQLDFAAHAPGA